MRVVVRSFAVWTAAIVIAVSLYVALCAGLLAWHGSHDNATNADAIVVMGAAQYDGTPSPLLELRLTHALAVWKAGRAPLIAVTGGKKEGDRFTEAEASRRWLIGNGVPAAAIVGEDRGASTWESLSQLATVLRTAGVKRVIAVSSRWHVQRVVLSLDELGFVASASAARVPGYAWFDEDDASTGTYREIIGVSIGRLIGFGRLFDLTG